MTTDERPTVVWIESEFISDCQWFLSALLRRDALQFREAAGEIPILHEQVALGVE